MIALNFYMDVDLYKGLLKTIPKLNCFESVFARFSSRSMSKSGIAGVSRQEPA